MLYEALVRLLVSFGLLVVFFIIICRMAGFKKLPGKIWRPVGRGLESAARASSRRIFQLLSQAVRWAFRFMGRTIRSLFTPTTRPSP